MIDPIIITGVPRSRTSMTTGILSFCGLQLGDVIGPTPNNKKGQFENRDIIEKVEKKHLKLHKFDPMGQYPLPIKLPIDAGRKYVVLNILKKQGVNFNKPWGFKDSKSILSFNSWINAFPYSKWIIVNRKKEDIARSCELTPFMHKRKDWLNFVVDYRSRFETLKKVHDKVYEINTDDIVNFKFDSLKDMVSNLGLIWDEKKVMEFVDPNLTRLK